MAENEFLNEVDAPPPLQYVRFKGLERLRSVFFMQRIKDEFVDEAEEKTAEDAEIEALTFEGNEYANDPYGVFACYEQEASLKKKSPYQRYRVVAVGDMKTYARTIVKAGIKPGQRIEVEKAKEIMRSAWSAEFEAAKLNRKRRPVGQHKYIAGVSKDVENPEELVDSFLGGRKGIQP